MTAIKFTARKISDATTTNTACAVIPVFSEGKLRLDQWQDKEGNNRSKLKVVVDDFQFVDSKGDGGGGGGGGRSPQNAYSGGGGGGQQSYDPPPQVSEDDIPF